MIDGSSNSMNGLSPNEIMLDIPSGKCDSLNKVYHFAILLCRLFCKSIYLYPILLI